MHCYLVLNYVLCLLITFCFAARWDLRIVEAPLISDLSTVKSNEQIMARHGSLLPVILFCKLLL